MSIILGASNAFYDVCAFLARGVHTGTNAANYIVQLNYNLVTTSYSTASRCASTVTAGLGQVWGCLCSVATYCLDFVYECHSFARSAAYLGWRGLVGVHNFIAWSWMTVANLFTFCGRGLSQTYLTFCQGSRAVYEAVSSMFDFGVAAVTGTVSTIAYVLSTLGSGCVNFVTGVWQGLGFVLSSVAYFPVYCVECVESAKQRLTNAIVSAVTITPKETYLGIVCLCLMYFILSNTFRYLSCRGVPLFSRRSRSRRRGQNSDWHFDREFESDFEDMYTSDTEDRTWMVMFASPRGDGDSDINGDDSDGGYNDNDSNDSGTVDNDVSDDDDDDDDDDNSESEDENTAVSEDSDSDASLESQTFSTTSSDHDIEIQLPSLDERYNLRNRSSTPSRLPKSMSCPEDFDREMERERDKRKCVVCQDQIKSVVVMPCKHMCMCVDCANHIVRSRSPGRRVCPLCRTRIQKVMDLFV